MAHVTRLCLLALLCGGLLLTSVNAQKPGVTLGPKTAEQLVAEAERAAGAHEYDRAVDAYRQAIKLNPDLAVAYHGLGITYNNMGRPGDSIEPLRVAERLDPDNARIHLSLGISYSNLRRGEEALSELQEAKRLNPNNPRVHNEIGNVLGTYFGRLDDALVAYGEARRLDPTLPFVYFNIGLTQTRLGHNAEALTAFQEAVRLDPAYRDSWFYVGDLSMKFSRYEPAIEAFTKFLELKPDGPDALTNRTWLYMYLGGHGREAAADARRFLTVHGWRDYRSLYLAVIANLAYRQSGMDDEAKAILAEATKQATTTAWPYALVTYLNGASGADEVLKSAVNNDQRTEAHAYLGMDLLLKGMSEEARTHFAWVKEYGNKRFFEYPLAVAELKRMGR